MCYNRVTICNPRWWCHHNYEGQEKGPFRESRFVLKLPHQKSSSHVFSKFTLDVKHKPRYSILFSLPSFYIKWKKWPFGCMALSLWDVPECAQHAVIVCLQLVSPYYVESSVSWVKLFSPLWILYRKLSMKCLLKC